MLVVGDQSVGKTQLICVSTGQRAFNDVSKSTIGVQFSCREIETAKKQKVALQIWDTAGQERCVGLLGGCVCYNPDAGTAR